MIWRKIPISISNSDWDRLNNIYATDTSHENRQRAHSIIMYKNKINLNTISQSLSKDIDEILILLKALNYFGLNYVFSSSITEISERIKEREKKIQFSSKILHNVLIALMTICIVLCFIFLVVILLNLSDSNFPWENISVSKSETTTEVSKTDTLFEWFEYNKHYITLSLLIAGILIIIRIIPLKLQFNTNSINHYLIVAQNSILSVSMKFYNNIVAGFKIVSDFIWGIWKFFFKIILLGINKISHIDYRKYYVNINRLSPNIKNIIRIGRGGSGNIIIQITNNLPRNGESHNEPFEIIIANTLKEAVAKFYDIFLNQANFVSDNRGLAFFLAINEKIQSIEKIQRRKRLTSILATVATIYFLHYIAIKSGLVVVSVGIPFLTLCLSLTNLSSSEKGIISNSMFNLKRNDSIKRVLTNNTIKKLKNLDSINKTAIYNSGDTLNQNSLFMPDDSCSNLALIGLTQIRHINNSVESNDENYIIKVPDEKLYLRVAAYKNIKEAIFQRKYLVDNGYENSKILELNKDGKPLYAVTIADFSQNNILNLCDLKQEWDNVCSKTSVTAQLQMNK